MSDSFINKVRLAWSLAGRLLTARTNVPVTSLGTFLVKIKLNVLSSYWFCYVGLGLSYATIKVLEI